jgi:hypothetical protein
MNVTPIPATTAAAKWDEAVNRKSVLDIPGLSALMTEHAQAMDQLNHLPFIESEKTKRRQAAEAQVREKVAALVATARQRLISPLDQAEGQARRAARGEGLDASTQALQRQAFLHEKAKALAQQVATATDAASARQVFEDALLSDDEHVIRLVGIATRDRLLALAEKDRGAAISHARNQATAFGIEFDRWRKAHLTPSETIADIQRQRGNLILQFERSAEHAARLFGLLKE